LDVSSNAALVLLKCGNNRLTGLDVTANTALVLLKCDSNQLTELDVCDLSSLWRLYCGGNPLDFLDLSNNTFLYYFSSYGADGGLDFTIDLSFNTALGYLECNQGQPYTGVGDGVSISEL